MAASTVKGSSLTTSRHTSAAFKRLLGAASCPAGTVAASAEVQVETNSVSGRSPFVLCALK
jgi:hypothetical protein